MFRLDIQNDVSCHFPISPVESIALAWLGKNAVVEIKILAKSVEKYKNGTGTFQHKSHMSHLQVGDPRNEISFRRLRNGERKSPY